MKRITLKTLTPRIARPTWYKKEVVKEILGHLCPEINYELSQGNDVSLISIVTLSVEKTKYKTRYSPRLKTNIKVKDKFRVKASVSDVLKKNVNFWK